MGNPGRPRRPLAPDANRSRHRNTGSKRTPPRVAALAPPAANDIETVDIGPLADMIGYALRRAQLAVFDDVISALGEIGLRPAEFSTLTVLATSPGRSQSAIASALGIQRANFVALIDRLETRGLAERRRHPADRRSHALYLTLAGQALLARAASVHGAHERRQIAKLGEDNVAILLALLARLSTP
jgi:DNA-binding MarR family transcriptional regulator